MPTHLLIDGYNFIKRGSVASLFDPTDIDSARDYTISRLSEYQKERRVRIVVVFDATEGISLSRKSERRKGIEIVYSKQGETADDVIIETVRRRLSGLVVVSSDRAIIDEAKRNGVAFITPGRLEAAMCGDEEPDHPRDSEKKGNGRKAPKSLRKARQTMKKI
jgi:uncharacterized protein